MSTSININTRDAAKIVADNFDDAKDIKWQTQYLTHTVKVRNSDIIAARKNHYGFNPFISGNIGYTAHLGDAYVAVGASFGMGGSYNQVSKENTALSMLAGGAEVGYGDVGVGITTARFDSKGKTSNTSQRIGGVNFRAGDVNLAYQNDFVGVKNNINLLSDGGDRFRTASVRASYKDYSIGFKLATGDPGYPIKKSEKDPETGRETYIEDKNKDYRIGAVYIGYQNYQFGWTSEFIRHTIQNKWTHDGILHGDSKWFKVLDKKFPAGFYGNNSPYYRYSLW